MTEALLPPLPVLKPLVEPETFMPTIIIDSREQLPLPLTRFPVITGTLLSGDYSIVGLEHLFSVERKSLDDLAGCITKERERFERELHRLRGYHFQRLLIVGSEQDILDGHYHSKVSPQSILGSLQAFECRYNLPFVFEPTPEQAAQRVESWAYYYMREVMKQAEQIRKAVIV